MSKLEILKSLVSQRLTSAGGEISGLFERTMAEDEEELSSLKEENARQRRLLDAISNPEVRLQRADIQQLLVVKEKVPPEKQVWTSSLDQDQEDPEPPHIKEDQEVQSGPRGPRAPPHLKGPGGPRAPPHLRGPGGPRAPPHLRGPGGPRAPHIKEAQ